MNTQKPLHEQLPPMGKPPRDYTEEEQVNCVAYLKSMGWEHLDNRLSIIREELALVWKKPAMPDGGPPMEYRGTEANLRMMEDLCIRARLELFENN